MFLFLAVVFVFVGVDFDPDPGQDPEIAPLATEADDPEPDPDRDRTPVAADHDLVLDLGRLIPRDVEGPATRPGLSSWYCPLHPAVLFRVDASVLQN